jgi:hypothetical protein
MVKLSSFSERRVVVEVKVEGAEITLTVQPNVMTPALERRLSEAEGSESMDLLLDLFCRYVAAWDVTDDDGVPLDLVPDVVAQLPSTVLVGILRAARERLDELGN